MESPENPPAAVHVIVPAYNAGWSIPDTIRSILVQTFANFLVTIVDDGSTEELAPVLNPLIGADPRFRVVRQRNEGLASARNRGLAEVRSPFVAFLDSDDVWHPDFLNRLLPALRTEAAAPFAYVHSYRFDGENRLIPAPRWRYKPRHDLVGLLTLNTVASGSASVFRTEAIRAVGGFDPSLRTRRAEGAEDWKLTLRLAATATPVLVPDYLAAYRLIERSMSQSDPARQLRAVRMVMEDLRAELRDVPERGICNARTAMNGWLLGAFLRKGEYLTAVSLLVESYLRNPFWFATRELRTIHAMKIGTILMDRGPRVHMADLLEPDGRRPFAFLR